MCWRFRQTPISILQPTLSPADVLTASVPCLLLAVASCPIRPSFTGLCGHGGLYAHAAITASTKNVWWQHVHTDLCSHLPVARYTCTHPPDPSPIHPTLLPALCSPPPPPPPGFLYNLIPLLNTNLPRVWVAVEGGLCEPVRSNISHGHPSRIGGDYDDEGLRWVGVGG